MQFIYESKFQKIVIHIIPNSSLYIITNRWEFHFLLSPTGKVGRFLLSGNIQHITSHIASAVTFFIFK